MKRFNMHSTHGGASDDDGDVPVTVMNKRTNQLGTKQYDIKAKLKQGFAKSSGSPESHGHGEAHPTVMLPAAKKKHSEQWFLAKSGDQCWLVGCARN